MPSVNAGRINEVTPSLPLTGNQPSQSEKVKINSGPITKLGIETPSTAVIIENLSKIESLCTADNIPSGTEIRIATNKLAKLNIAVGNACSNNN